MTSTDDRLRPDGPAIRLQRRQQGIRSRDLAEAVGISRQHMVNIECGHNGASPEVLYRIANALSVRIEQVSTNASTSTGTDPRATAAGAA
jgi:transcriptional regulator with XRE-family HTH domain